MSNIQLKTIRCNADAGELVVDTGATGPRRVTFIKLSAGNVAIGNSQSLAPITGGAGMMLPSDVAVTIDFPEKEQIYVQSETAGQLVSVAITPIPGVEIRPAMPTAAPGVVRPSNAKLNPAVVRR